MGIRVSIAAVLFPLALAPSELPAQQSASYSLERVTATAAASTTASASFESQLLFAPVAPSGASSFCSAGFVNSLGYYSTFGDLPVPIRLKLGKQQGNPSVVELMWTGAEEGFELYRSTVAHTILDEDNLEAELTDCADTDGSAVGPNLWFYRVVGANGG